MTTLVVIYLHLLSLLLLAMMVIQYVRGTHELLSLRNVALLGFIIFQLTGPTDALRGDTTFSRMLQYPSTTALIYAAMATILLAVFLWSYNNGFFVKRLARITPTSQVIPSIPLLWLLAVAFLIIGAFFRVGVHVPLLSQLAHIWSIALAAAACAIVGWIWGPRLLNPLVICGVVLVVVASATIAMTGAFGRRALVALAVAVLWGMYFSHLRYLRPAFVLPRLAVVAIVPLMFIALYTSARAAGDKDRTAMDHIRAIRTHGDLVHGLSLLFAGQDAGANSLWLIEQFPGPQFKTRPFFTIGYVFMYPVPRNLWTSKPEPLSAHLPHMMLAQNVNRDALTLGPGIIGHAAAEGGWFALLAYALLGGLLIRFADELVRLNTWSPFVVLPVGVSFGQVLGFARGETAAFVALFILGVTFTYFTMVLLGKMLERMSGNKSTMHVEEMEEWAAEPEQSEYEHDWGQFEPAMHERAGTY